MSQLEAIWDVARGTTARLVYLWTAMEVLDAEVALLANLIVMMDAAKPGEYPHTLAMGWHQEGFTCDETRAWIRAGVHDPVDASRRRARGESPAAGKPERVVVL